MMSCTVHSMYGYPISYSDNPNCNDPNCRNPCCPNYSKSKESPMLVPLPPRTFKETSTVSNPSTTSDKEVLELTVRVPAQDYNPQQTNHLVSVALEDIEQVLVKDQTYRGSWHRRGGIGAFMMLARKWDRLEEILKQGVTALPPAGSPNAPQLGSNQYDILKLLEIQDQQGISGDDGSVLAEIRDLRRYLLLVETYFIQHKTPYSPPKEDTPVPNYISTAKDPGDPYNGNGDYLNRH